MQIWKSFGDVLATTINKFILFDRVLLLNSIPHNEPHRLSNQKNLGYTAEIADFFYPVARTCFIDL